MPFRSAPSPRRTFRSTARARNRAPSLRHFLASYRGRVLIAADSAGRREALIEQLAGAGLRPRCSMAGVRSSTATTRWPSPWPRSNRASPWTTPRITVLTERELFGERVRTERKKRRGAARDPESIIRDLTELSIGSPIVHIDHGVGRYQGLVSLEVGDMPGEFLTIEYAKGDKLYVPVAQLGLVSRYTGTAPELAPLHSLGGDAWERARKNAAEKVRDVAAELLGIYAQREARGRANRSPSTARWWKNSPPPSRSRKPPTSSRRSIAVLVDLAAPRAMDRVVCGDVGFGKTEVALRAAFAAATAGKQVAVLVPTTLLAQQHYRNFADRFADWPVRVDVLSRFKSKKEVDDALERLAEGQIDVIVGTHKLLQADIRFKNLGLVIVDEEQRFGVRQKEQLEEAARGSGPAHPDRHADPAHAEHGDGRPARPVHHRHAACPPHWRCARFITQLAAGADPRSVPTRAGTRRPGVLPAQRSRAASTARRANCSELVPEARIRVAHGQMPERELEQVMADFHRQRFNVLVCTTIIESGIDIPTANTIVINRADRFGLAQLHQLRGRVGRSHHRAYAYLVVPDRKAMTADAEKRLEALASLEELGAGFTLATHDLEIRGAGEMLGDEQSGQIQEIGFGLYTELLDRAVRALKSGKVPDFDLTSEHETEVELHLPALIPDDYLPDVHSAPDALQAHRQRPQRRELARTASGNDRPLRPASRPDQATVRHRRAEADGHAAGHPQARLRRQRRTHDVPRQARRRPDGDHQTDPATATGLQARWPGQAAGEPGAARRHRTHAHGHDVLVALGARRPG